jgi:hypothetical protein
MRKAFKIGFLAVALLAAAHTPTGGRVAQTVRSLEQHLNPSRSAEISPIERLVLRLATLS